MLASFSTKDRSNDLSSSVEYVSAKVNAGNSVAFTFQHVYDFLSCLGKLFWYRPNLFPHTLDSIPDRSARSDISVRIPQLNLEDT